jgi:phage-related protein
MGTSIESIQNAYQGFAKQNYTMLDNLKLGYGGTQEEMKRLIADAAKLDSSVEKNNMSFANIVKAINVVQTEMGITGTTAREASETISGSISSMKSAWANLVTGIADENANMEELIGNFIETLVGDGSGKGGVINNILPRIEQALEGVGQLVETMIPIIVDMVPTIVNEWLPKILQSGITMVQTIFDGMIKNSGSITAGAVSTIITFINGILDNLPEILVSGAMLIGQFAAGLIQALPEVLAKIPEIIVAIWDAFAANGDVFIEIGKSIVVGIWNGICALWNSLVENMSWLTSGLTAGFSYMGAGGIGNAMIGAVNGSHADGLAYVPFDGYVAQLHEGERVLTKKEAREYNGSDADDKPIKIIVQSVLDGKVIGETAYNYSRRKARAGGI